MYPSEARDINYCPVDDENLWRIDFLKELVDLKHGDLNIGLNHDEIYEIIEDICTSYITSFSYLYEFSVCSQLFSHTSLTFVEYQYALENKEK